jgi:hypothetical protein
MCCATTCGRPTSRSPRWAATPARSSSTCSRPRISSTSWSACSSWSRTSLSARLEPVLSELLYYYERDEARHVGLGALALPTILPGLSAVEAGRLWLYQLRVQLLLVAGGLTMRDEFATLGIDQAAMQLYGFELQRAVYRRMGHEKGDSPAATRGLFKMSRAGQDRINRFLFAEKNGQPPPGWQSEAFRAVLSLARRGDRWLAARA